METVITAVNTGIATITLNRPKAFNAINFELARELREALERVEAESEVQCVVIQGAGGNFMAGGDLAFFASRLQELETGDTVVPREMFDNVNGSIQAIRRMPKPIIASIHGAVAGFGLSLMSACDLVIASDKSIFTAGYGQVALNPDGGGTHFLPRTIGLKRTMELFLLGNQYSAVQAWDMGLINRVVTKDELAIETAMLAGRLAALPSVATANVKQLVNGSFHTSLDEQLHAEEEGVHQCTTTADFAEGVTAFLEKRGANFNR